MAKNELKLDPMLVCSGLYRIFHIFLSSFSQAKASWVHTRFQCFEWFLMDVKGCKLEYSFTPWPKYECEA
jgi:hypothetical protein